MEKEACLRLLRRICAAVLALLAAIVMGAPVLADEAGPAGETPEDPAAQEQTLTEENFAAVAAQLEAVAREQGRSIADKMLYESFRMISPVSAPAEAEATAAPTAAPARNTPAVVVHSSEQQTLSFSGFLPFLAVAVIAVTSMLAVFFSTRRHSWTGRRPAFARGYRPAHDRTFREETLERRSALRLNR
ncbi:MAG: hypothetical protein ACI4GO_06410 [Hominenteromicrobium sp.]